MYDMNLKYTTIARMGIQLCKVYNCAHKNTLWWCCH